MLTNDNLIPIDDATISRVARECARDLYPPKDIRERYHLSIDQFDQVVQTPFFKQRLAEELELWNASDARTIANRIGVKAATMIEECLIEVYSLIHDRSQPMQAKIAALQWASRLAGVGENPSVKEGTTGERVKFNIFINNQRISFDQSGELPAPVIEGSATLVDKDPNV
jgi:hypothetical protein